MLRWRLTTIAGTAQLRVKVAQDVREGLAVRGTCARKVLDYSDQRLAYPFHPFDLELSPSQAGLAAVEGVELTLEKGEGPLWLFQEVTQQAKPALLVHLRSDQTPGYDSFAQALSSPAIAQPFGWMEGCVLDGLHQRIALLGKQEEAAVIKWHFEAFFDRRKMSRYVPHSETCVRHGSEGLLPFAVLAKYEPGHPAFDGMLEYCEREARGEGVIQDGQVTTAEGCYTLAYPLAALGGARDQRRLRQLAIRKLVHRMERLTAPGVLYLRVSDAGQRTFANWARGIAWFALGLIRTMNELERREVPETVREAFQWCADLVLKWQGPEGLWRCFIDQPETGIETSGSAGIATALAVGSSLLKDPAGALRAARSAHKELMSRYLLPDGFLGTVSQANRDG